MRNHRKRVIGNSDNLLLHEFLPGALGVLALSTCIAALFALGFNSWWLLLCGPALTLVLYMIGKLGWDEVRDDLVAPLARLDALIDQLEQSAAPNDVRTMVVDARNTLVKDAHRKAPQIRVDGTARVVGDITALAEQVKEAAKVYNAGAASRSGAQIDALRARLERERALKSEEEAILRELDVVSRPPGITGT